MIRGLIAASLLLAPPYFQRETGGDLAAMVARGINVVSQQNLDVAGTPAAERVVLLGRPGDDGSVVVVGLAVLDVERGFRVLASAALPTNAAYDVAFGGAPVDLDGDGKMEIAIDAVASSTGVGRFEDTFYLSVVGATFVSRYALSRLSDRGGVRQARTMSVIGPGRILERLTTRSGAEETKRVTELAWDRALGRFTPLLARP